MAYDQKQAIAHAQQQAQVRLMSNVCSITHGLLIHFVSIFSMRGCCILVERMLR
jgi:hypothetical protein